MHKRSWHADASDSRETLIDNLTSNLVADAKLKEQASFKEMVLQDNFFASLESPEDQNVKASIAAALRSDAGNRGNTSKQRGPHSSCVGILNRFLASVVCTPQWRLEALPQGRMGQRAFHLGKAFCRRQESTPACRVEET